MSDPIELKRPLTDDEQKRIISEVYQWRDSAEITDEEIKMLREMFDTPAKFVLLRRVLGLLTNDERGITIPGKDATVSGADYEEIGREVTIRSKADERIRNGLLRFYQLVRDTLREEKRNELEEASAKAQERIDEENSRGDINRPAVGDNL